jgi:hypothetical protein
MPVIISLFTWYYSVALSYSASAKSSLQNHTHVIACSCLHCTLPDTAVWLCRTVPAQNPCAEVHMHLQRCICICKYFACIVTVLRHYAL